MVFRSCSARLQLLALALPLSSLLLAHPAAAVPFSLQVYENGSLAGSYGTSTSWLSCSESGTTTDCSSAVGHAAGTSDLMLDSWTMHFDDADPVVSGIVAVTNSSSTDQHYTLFFTLPVAPMSPSTLTSGSIQGGITDNDGNGATLSAPAGGSLYAAILDGVTTPPFQTLYDDPTSISALAYDSASLGTAHFGYPSPPSLPGPAVASSIGIRLDFVLSGNDSASFTSNFVVEPVPEPTTGLLMGLGLVGLVVAQRRKA